MKTQSIKILNSKIFRPFLRLQKETISEHVENKWLSLKKNNKLREQSIDFLWKACSKYQFNKDTLFLAIKIMDSLIQGNFKPIFQDSRLTAASLVILTTKYNEVYPVTIDQINLITQKHYPREKFFEIQGSILEFLKFQIPQVTVYSQLYNEMKRTFGQKIISSDSDKENDESTANSLKTVSEKIMKVDDRGLAEKTLKAIQQPECFKYGEQILVHALLNLVKNQKNHGNSLEIVKTNYIKAILKKLIQPEIYVEEKRKISISNNCVSPSDEKLNPEKKVQLKQKIFVF